jgi:hypothetical protein
MHLQRDEDKTTALGRTNTDTFGTLKKLPLKLLFSSGDTNMMHFFRALPAPPQIALRAGFPN